VKQELCSNAPSVAQYFNSTVKEIVSPVKIKCSNINGDTFYTFDIPVPEDVRELYVLQIKKPMWVSTHARIEYKNGSVGNCLIYR